MPKNLRVIEKVDVFRGPLCLNIVVRKTASELSVLQPQCVFITSSATKQKKLSQMLFQDHNNVAITSLQINNLWQFFCYKRLYNLLDYVSNKIYRRLVILQATK